MIEIIIFLGYSTVFTVKTKLYSSNDEDTSTHNKIIVHFPIVRIPILCRCSAKGLTQLNYQGLHRNIINISSNNLYRS